MKIPDEDVRDMDVEKFMFTDERESFTPKGKRKIVEKYTKQVMNELYDKKVQVFFCSFKNAEFPVNKAMFRSSYIKPLNKTDLDKWNSSNPSITFDADFYTEDKLLENIWLVIVHEVTHIEVPAVARKNGSAWEVNDRSDMDKIVKKNLLKVKAIGRKFIHEAELDIDDIIKWCKSLKNCTESD